MTSPSFSIASKKMFVFLAAAIMVITLGNLPAQEEAAKYSEQEYQAFQEISNEASPAKKTSLVVTFIKTYPKSALRNNVVSAYQGMINELRTARKWQEIITYGQQYQAFAPDDAYTISVLATAYQESKNYRQFVVFGEKAFASKPSANLAYYIAKAYLELDDNANFLQWGEKTAQLMPDNHEILFELTRRYGAIQNNAQASKYAKLAIKALQAAKMPEGTKPDAWKSYQTNVYATCYTVVGVVANEGRDYAGAVANLENSVKYYKGNDQVYYNLGMAYWQLSKIDMAMLNLAKAYVMNKATSRAAKQNLDNLYKSTHQQSLAGEDRIIARAQAELKQ
jgi:tetratricopeptide (TPR) repeat protein